MEKGDILYCIKEVGRTVHLNYVGNTRLEEGYDEYWIFYENNKPYRVHSVWEDQVSIWRPMKDAIKLGLPSGSEADTVFYYTENDGGYKMNLWDYFVTEEEYKNQTRFKKLKEILQ